MNCYEPSGEVNYDEHTQFRVLSGYVINTQSVSRFFISLLVETAVDKVLISLGPSSNKFGYIRISRSAHRTPNFTNPKFQFPQFKVLQSVVFFLFK